MSQGPNFEPVHGSQYNRQLAAGPGSSDQIVTARKIRVAVASAVRLVRESLTLSLRDCEGIVVVDAVGLDSEGIAQVAAATPDVILVDVAIRNQPPLPACLRPHAPTRSSLPLRLLKSMKRYLHAQLRDLQGMCPAKGALMNFIVHWSMQPMAVCNVHPTLRQRCSAACPLSRNSYRLRRPYPHSPCARTKS